MGRITTPFKLHLYSYVGGSPVAWLDLYGFDRSLSDGSIWLQMGKTDNAQLIHCQTEECAPSQVWFGLRNPPYSDECIIYFGGVDSDILLGGVSTVFILQPLRDIPVVGQFIEHVLEDKFPALKWQLLGEKMAAQLVAGESLDKVATDLAYDLIVDIVSSPLANRMLNMRFDLKGLTVSVDPGAKEVLEPTIEWVADKLKSIVEKYAAATCQAQEWEYKDLPHCIGADVGSPYGPKCYANFEALLRDFPGAAGVVSNCRYEFYVQGKKASGLGEP